VTTTTPLLTRIQERQPPEPEPIAERMSPFMRRLRDKNLPVRDMTNDRPLFTLHDGCGPDGRAA